MTDIPENIDFSEHGVALWRSSFKGIYTDWEEGDFGCGACLAPRHIYKLTSSEILSVFIRVIRGQKDLKPILPRVNGEEGDEEQQQGDADQGEWKRCFGCGCAARCFGVSVFRWGERVGRLVRFFRSSLTETPLLRVSVAAAPLGASVFR